jgi:hypothetical protein
MPCLHRYHFTAADCADKHQQWPHQSVSVCTCTGGVGNLAADQTQKAVMLLQLLGGGGGSRIRVSSAVTTSAAARPGLCFCPHLWPTLHTQPTNPPPGRYTKSLCRTRTVFPVCLLPQEAFAGGIEGEVSTNDDACASCSTDHTLIQAGNLC